MKLSLGKGFVRLCELEAGSLFRYDETLALKSEYRNEKGACMCYIVGSGEMFWGGTTKADDLNNMFVVPVAYIN